MKKQLTSGTPLSPFATNEFELHARAILGLPVDTRLREPGASAVIYGQLEEKGIAFTCVEEALRVPQSDIRLFGKPESFTRRRMGVALANGKDTDEARARAKLAAGNSEASQVVGKFNYLRPYLAFQQGAAHQRYSL
jgi:phosphoribosylglycinamide formyltransferase 2